MSSDVDGRESNTDKVVLNVGGGTFVTSRMTLAKLSNTKLSNLSKQRKDPKTGVYFFDRNPEMFHIILDFFRMNEIHVPTNVCGPRLKAELKYWGISDKFIAPCCWRAYSDYDDEQKTIKDIDSRFCPPSRLYIRPIPEWRTKMWKFLDDPRSSKGAQVWSYFSVLVILVSITSFVLETLPECRIRNHEKTDHFSNISINNQKLKMYLHTTAHPAIKYLDWACVCFFTVELTFRFCICPYKLEFARSALNIIDALAVLPMWILLIIDATLLSNLSGLTVETVKAYIYLSCARTLRVFRLFKIGHQYDGLRVLILALGASVKELMLLGVFMVIGILIYSSLIYYAEFEVANNFENIPIGFWWSVITMTTVGYGDKVPKSIPGYIIGGLCSVTGLVVIGLPIPIIASNFGIYYSYAKQKKRMKNKRDILLSRRSIYRM